MALPALAPPTLAGPSVAPVNSAPVTSAPVNSTPVNSAPVTSAPGGVAPVTVAGPNSAPVGVTPVGVAGAVETLESAVRQMQWVLRATAPSALSGDEALVLVDLFAQAERTAASGIALFSPRVLHTGAHAKVGHVVAADWLGAISGSSASVAKDRLAAATTASADAALTEALHLGELSCAQLAVLGHTEAAAPGSAKTLLGLTGAGASHHELATTATALIAAARSKEDEATRRARVHEHRHLRLHQCPSGGVRVRSSATRCNGPRWPP